MKYIHGKEIKGKASGGAIVMIVFGTLLILAFLGLAALMIAPAAHAEAAEAVTADSSNLALLIFEFPFFVGGGFMLLFFGIKKLKKSLKGIPMRAPGKNEPMDPMNPFFTVSCPVCATRFDYQKSDLGRRAWFPNGFVSCPCCGKPIRHHAEQNVYQEFIPDSYTYKEI